MSTTKVGSPGALIAALPAVLGFTPTESLVVTALGRGGELMAALRADLADMADEAAFTDLAGMARRAGALSAIAVVVNGDESECCPMCAEEAGVLCERLQAALTGEGVDLLGCHVVGRIAAGVRWVCADGCGTSGTVDDPSASPLAAAAVVSGRRVSGSRESIKASLKHKPDDAIAVVIDVMPEWADTTAIQAALDVVRRDGRSTAAMATLAVVLAKPDLRDAFLGLAGTGLAANAEDVLTHAARVLPRRWRPDALACVAFLAYCRGDGPLAGIAVDAGLEGAADHHLLGLLDAALRGGVRPGAIRPLAAVARQGIADKFGVALPGAVS